MSFSKPLLTLPLAIIAVTFLLIPTAMAEAYYQGPLSCQECHKEEAKTWETTVHFLSYRTAHKSKNAKKIARAVGGKKNMKRNAKCSVCHYSLERKKPEDKAKVKYGPSCESCHGASSDWEVIHSDYGGKSVTREQETSEHRAKRIADSSAAGLAWASDSYDIAANCMKCHGLARSEIDASDFAKMLEAEHPINTEFEIVLYSQGRMYHRKGSRTPAQLAKLFVAGQAAKLVSAIQAASSATDGPYKAAQVKRASAARTALQAVPQAAAFLAAPNAANARKLLDDIGQQDLSGQVGALIPCAKPDRENLRQC